MALLTDRAAAFGLASLGTNISTNSIAMANDLAFLAPWWVKLTQECGDDGVGWRVGRVSMEGSRPAPRASRRF